MLNLTNGVMILKGSTMDNRKVGDTFYRFPVRPGKRPEFGGSEKFKRSKKKYQVKKLRNWQSEAFKKLANSKFFLIKAFCGAGKTTLSVVLALQDAVKNGRKQIFLVPQEHIGDGFATNGKFEVPGLGIVTLTTPNNFCEDSEKKVDMLINFLQRNIKLSEKDFVCDGEYVVDGSDCFAVCTHQAFNMAIAKIKESDFNDACKNISFYVDEAHHVKGGEENEKDEKKIEESYNRLGSAIYEIMKTADANNTRVGLSTATFFRGDQGVIVKNDYLNKFDKYELDFLSHFETLNINNVDFKFETYATDPIDQIVENIRKELKNHRHLIVVPTINAKWRKKDADLSKLKSSLNKMLIEEGENPDEIVLDLVERSTQRQNKAILLKEPKEEYNKENPSKIKIVITCMLGREGTDWCPCSRLHNASIERTPTIAVQTLGRLFRKFEKKNSVGVTYYMEKYEKIKTSKTFREFLTDRVNAVLTLMIIDDMFCPIILPELPPSSTPKKTDKKGTKSRESKGIKLSDIFGDKYSKVRDLMLEQLGYAAEFNEETVEQVIESSLDKLGLSFDDVVQIKKGKIVKYTTKRDIIDGLKVFLLKARSEALRNKGIDISMIRKAGFDEIVEHNDLGGNFWLGKLNKKKFAEFKSLIGKCFWNEGQKITMASNIEKYSNEIFGVKIQMLNQRTMNDFLKRMTAFHKAYNQVVYSEGCNTPDREKVAKKLNISLYQLNEEVKVFNKILPKGFLFFGKNTKINEKFAVEAA